MPLKRDREASRSTLPMPWAVTRYVEERTGLSIKRFVRTARTYRTVQIQAGGQILTAEDPLPGDLRDALEALRRPGAH